MVTESIVQRLAFVKYLYGLAVNQSRQPEPLSSSSILTFHDSIEFFLQIASEYLDVGNNRPNFLDYWDILSVKLVNGLTQKEAMRRLNKCRVALKHHGTMPSKLDIEAIRASATNFFVENCPTIFDLEFEKISLINLIECTQVRECLEEASKLMEDKKYSDALVQIGLSFHYLIDDYENKQKTDYGRSPFFFGQDLNFESSFFMGIEDRKFSRFVDKVRESIQSMQSAMKIVSLGLDYRRHVKFRLLTPTVMKTIGGQFVTEMRGQKYTVEQCEYCINFVIDSALRLQEDVGIPEG